MTRLIIGLGNPGAQYAKNRHNAGFMLLDHLLESHSPNVIWRETPRFLWCQIEAPFRTYLLKPITYMNLSGNAVSDFLETHPLPLEHCLVAYDDLALPVGRMRYRAKGSSGGQKGMRHILEVLGTEEVPRLRLGIGPPRNDQSIPDFVLSDFSGDEARIFKKLMGSAVQSLVCWAAQGISIAMSQFNGLELIDSAQEGREE